MPATVTQIKSYTMGAGSPYNSKNWAEYTKTGGFETGLCTPEHQQATGQAEKFMSSIVKVTHASIAEGKDPK